MCTNHSREVFCLPGFMATADKVLLPAGDWCVGLPCAQKQEPASRQTHGLGNNTAERHHVHRQWGEEMVQVCEGAILVNKKRLISGSVEG